MKKRGKEMKKGTLQFFDKKYIVIEEIHSDEPIRQEVFFSEQRRPLHSEGKPNHRQIPDTTLENDQEKSDSEKPINQPTK